MRTINDLVAREGNRIRDTLASRAKGILSKSGFNPDTGLPIDVNSLNPEWLKSPPINDTHDEDILSAVDEINMNREDDEKIKDIELAKKTENDPDFCVYAAIDDVGADKQKDTRKNGGSKVGKKVETTVIHIQYKDEKYIIAAHGMEQAFILLIAFLIENDLLSNKRLIFLTDGASNIRACIEKFFYWRSYTIYLDWFHVAKHCKELISQAIKGKIDIKKKYIQKFLRILWVGDYEGAYKYLESLGESKIKNRDKFIELREYLGRKAPYICCFAVRQKMKLRNSSGSVEGSNRLLVSNRQKHKGMSWSKIGSPALALVSCLYANGISDYWIEKQDIIFKFSKKVNKAA